MENGIQASDTQISQPVTAPVGTSSEAIPAESAQAERLFKQQDVDRIVSNAKKDAVERYRRLQTEQPEYAAQKYGQPAQAAPLPTGNNTYSQDDVRRIAAEETQRLMEQINTDAQRKAQTEQNQRIVADFFTKLNSGKEKYPDLEKRMGNMDLSKMANTVYLAKDLESQSVADVFMHFEEHPEKALQMEQLTYFNPSGAMTKLRQLAQSLKDNEAGQNVRVASSPLSQLRPSNSGMGSNANDGLSIAQAKAKYRG